MQMRGTLLSCKLNLKELNIIIRIWTHIVFYQISRQCHQISMPLRPIDIHIKTFKENVSIVLTVENNGLGIEEQHHPNLFNII